MWWTLRENMHKEWKYVGRMCRRHKNVCILFYNWLLLHYYKGATNPVFIFSVFVLAFRSVFFHLQHVSVALFVLDFDMCLRTGSFLKLWHFSRNGNVFALLQHVSLVDHCRFLEVQQIHVPFAIATNTLLSTL